MAYGKDLEVGLKLKLVFKNKKGSSHASISAMFSQVFRLVGSM